MLARGFITKEADLEPPVQGFEFYIDAFQELSTCRPGGMDLQPIPFTAIVEYSRIYDVGDFEEFKEIIQRMDFTFLRLHSEEREKTKPKAGDSAKSDTNADNKNNRGHKRK